MPIVDGVMAALFGFAALVQLNDPDPWRWTAVYAAAGALSGHAALRARAAGVPARLTSGLVGTAALAWTGWIMLHGPAPAAYGRMFETWEMTIAAVEEAREATGLLIVAVWMAVLTCRRRRMSPTCPPRSVVWRPRRQ